MPTRPPTPAPTTPPTPAPTAAPPPTPIPTPTRPPKQTPAPKPATLYDNTPAARLLKTTYSQVYESVKELPWAQASITGAEHDAIEWFYWLASRNWRATVTLIDLPWIQDSITETERDAIEWLYWLAREDWEAYGEAVAKPFLQTLEVDDVQTIREMSGRESQSYLERLSASYPAVAAPLQGLPWPQPPFTKTELHAIEGLYRLAQEDRQAAATVAAMPWVHDGINIAESEAINRIYGMSRREKSLVATVISLPWVQDDITLAESRAVTYLESMAHENKKTAAAVLVMPWVQDADSDIELDAFEWLRWLARNSDTAAATVFAMAWVQDGITETERDALVGLSWLAHDNETIASAIIAMPWITNGITETEADAIRWLRYLNRENAETATAIVALPWVQDGITKTEANAIQYLDWIGRKDSEAMTAIIAMPFLESVDSDDVLALRALSSPRNDDTHDIILTHPTLRNGITDDLTTLVVAIAAIYRDPGEIRRMLNPGYADIEVLLKGTELQPNLKVSIVRTGSQPQPWTARSVSDAAGFVERVMQQSLPFSHIVVVMNEKGNPEGYCASNHGFAFAYCPHFEQPLDTYRGHFFLSDMVHELAHYFGWTGMTDWISEGVADVIEYMWGIENEVGPGKLQVNRRGNCEAHDLEMLTEWDPDNQEYDRYSCTYYLGQLLFLELLEDLGTEGFNGRLRELYQLALAARAEGQRPGIAEVRQAFADQSEIVEKHWSGKLNAPENRR